jgi:hypothetical protein
LNLSRLRAFRPTPITWILWGALAILFLWLNLDASRDVYCRQIADGWQGGLQHGYPLLLWDSGIGYLAPQEGGVRILPYGGWLWFGLAVDLAAFAVALFATWFAGEWLQRRLTGPRRPPAAVRPVRLATALVLLAVAAGAVLVNLRVHIRVYPSVTAQAQFEQHMGWPLAFFEATGPYRMKKARNEAEAVPVAWTSYTRDDLPGFSNWYFGYLVGDIFIGLALALGSAAACEGLARSRRLPANSP